VLSAIPFGIDGSVAQPEIRGHVDDLDALGELRDLAMGGAVRQAAKGHVDAVPIDLIGGTEPRQVEACQMREDLRQRLAGMALGAQCRDGDLWMAGGKAPV
jgi:hypothetical protein